MSLARINQYYNELEDIYNYSGQNKETSIRRVTANLLSYYADKISLRLIDEVKLPNLTKVPDGGLFDGAGFNYGYWEAKDTADDLEKEIKHKINIGYPTENLLVENTLTAVLIRGNVREYCNMKDDKALDKFLTKYVSFVQKEALEFREALAQFAQNTPQIVAVLENMIKEQVSTNPVFKQKRQTFYELCQAVINPTVTLGNVDEMLIQHILTEEIFISIMNNRMFHEDNNISRTLTDIEKTFFVKDTKRHVLAKLEPYYKAVRQRAEVLTSHRDKQDFLKNIYENFYKAYNPANADRLGIVYTPSIIVKFMIESTEYLLEKYFDKILADKGVEILDPATGTGTFVIDLIKHIPPSKLAYKYKNELHANEVAILPYYIANLNIEYTYTERMKGEYEEFKNLCFVDTLDNTDALKYAGKQNDMFGDLAENALRIKAQNDRKISVIIGNPPYNAKQENFNDQNANRTYKEIDKQIKATFAKQGTAQNQIVLYDMYVRFYRWAMNRIDAKDGGIVAFITNRSFIDSRTFDGFRKCVQEDFQEIYIVDLMGDVRQNNTAVQGGNVFNIMTGVAIAFFIKIKDSDRKKARIQYYNIGEGLSAKDKLDNLRDNKLKDLDFERITPDVKHNWINQTDNDWDTLMPLCSKEVKAGKGNDEAIFELFSRGVATQRDEWVYDFNKQNLEAKMQYFTKIYEASRQDKNFKDKFTIKWDRELESYANRNIAKKFENDCIVESLYRPFVKQYMYFDKHFNGMTYQWYNIHQNKDIDKTICISGLGSSKPFQVLATKYIGGLDFLEKTQCLPLYRYEGRQVENITDWALGQFRAHYQSQSLPVETGHALSLQGQKMSLQPTINKIDIFHYVYAVLHSPTYREKYAQNLKRDFPRLPLYPDFWKYAQAGKELMVLHLWEGGDGSVEEGNLHSLSSHLPSLEVKTLPIESVLPKRKASPTYEAEQAELIKNYVPEVKLRVKDDIIEIDSLTTITGVPALAYQYKLGNRSAIEWVLDQYKPYKSSDETIQSNFNNYRFSDYKQEVIDLLLRVIYVSVRTMELVEGLKG